jgi:large subunit ribosomal protein L17
MRHSVFGRSLSRTTNERKRLFAGLVRSLLERDMIVTTIAKAKAVQPIIEKLISRAKLGKESDYRLLLQTVNDRNSVKRLMEDAKTRFAGRTSGYTRIIKLGKRLGDASEMVQFSFVDPRVEVSVIKPKQVKPAAVVEKSKKSEKAPVKKTVKKPVNK